MESVHLQLPAELLARVDEAAGDVPRNRWIRRAVEQALADDTQTGAQPSRDGVDGHFTRNNPSPTGAASNRGASEPPSPAERPVFGVDSMRREEELRLRIAEQGRIHQPGPNVENIRTSSQSKRDVRPIPKGGK